MKYVIYHKNCSDGTASALAAYLALGETAKYISMSYGEELPQLPNCEFLYIVDFSLQRNVMENLHKQLNGNIVVLDHHKTAEANLKGLLYCIFDMNKCGAVLAWEHFHKNVELPLFFQYIQDRDLWTNKLPYTEEVSAYIDSYPNSIEQFSNHLTEFLFNFNKVKKEGVSLLRYRNNLINKICGSSRKYTLSGYNCLVINTPMIFSSDIGSKLAEDNPDVKFICCYADTKDGTRHYSLRSKGDFDVSEIAKIYGGGGHRNAAGFSIKSSVDVLIC